MRKGRDGETKTGKKRGGKQKKNGKRLMKIVATTSWPAVDRPTAGTPHARANFQKFFPPTTKYTRRITGAREY